MMDPIWSHRWAVLEQRMKKLEKTLEGEQPPQPSSPSPSPTRTLYHLSQCLRFFATNQYHFFAEGFGRGYLKEIPEYPLDLVFRGIINQAFHDVQMIQLAAVQRRCGSAQMITALNNAVKLAWDALQPAIESGLIGPKTTVVTYFGKSASIRLIPYAPVALIAVPFSCTQVPRDYLAIPHEVGHYVFGRGQYQSSDRTLRKSINDSYEAGGREPTYCRKWIPEIFADLYGCLLAGPVIALDFQDLQLENDPVRFVEDDGEHPVPIMRPHVYIKALHGISDMWAKILNEFWISRRGGYTPEFQIKHNIAKISIASAISLDASGPIKEKPVDKVVASTLELLPAMNENCWQTSAWWAEVRGLELPPEISKWVSDGLPENAEPAIEAALYGPLEDRFDAGALGDLLEQLKDLPDLQPCDTQELDRILGSPDEFKAWVTDLLENWPTQFFEVARVRDGQAVEDFWVDVWLAQGWNTYGNGRWIQTS